MSGCKFANECKYINTILKNDEYYLEVYISNFCRYHFRDCSLWKAFNSQRNEDSPKCYMPFANKPRHDNR